MVPCNHCEPCLYMRAQKLMSRVKDECKNMKYSYFLTLTYDNKNIPLCRLHKDIDRWIPDSSRSYAFPILGNSDNNASSVKYVYSEYEMLPERFNKDSYRPFVKNLDNKDVFGIVSKVDCINFIKRLRRNLNSLLSTKQKKELNVQLLKLKDKFGYSSCVSDQAFYRKMRNNKEYQHEKEKILQQKRALRTDWRSELFRYFIVSEYGPKLPRPKVSTHRPHYHALLFADDETVYRLLPLAVSKSWQKCRERHRPLKPVLDEKVAGYVSKYVTGNTTLPAILRTKLTRTFYLCSRRPVIGIQSYNFEKVKEMHLRGTIYETQRYFTSNGELVETNVRLPKYVLSRYFPKCKEYSTMSFAEKLRVYSRFYATNEIDESLTSSFYKDFNLYPRYEFNPVVGKKMLVKFSDFEVMDLVAARACARWCKHFNCLPDEYVRILDWYYYKFDMDNLAQQFMLEELYPDVLHDETFFDDLPRKLDVSEVEEDGSILGVSQPIMELRYSSVGDKVANVLHLDVSYFYDDEGFLDESLFPAFYERNTSRYIAYINDVHDKILKSNKSKVFNDETLHSCY